LAVAVDGAGATVSHQAKPPESVADGCIEEARSQKPGWVR
jgi:hypothetical protein